MNIKIGTNSGFNYRNWFRMTTLLNFDICTHLKTKSEPVPERCKEVRKKAELVPVGKSIKKKLVINYHILQNRVPRVQVLLPLPKSKPFAKVSGFFFLAFAHNLHTNRAIPPPTDQGKIRFIVPGKDKTNKNRGNCAPATEQPKPINLISACRCCDRLIRCIVQIIPCACRSAFL